MMMTYEWSINTMLMFDMVRMNTIYNDDVYSHFMITKISPPYHHRLRYTQLVPCGCSLGQNEHAQCFLNFAWRRSMDFSHSSTAFGWGAVGQ